MVCKNKIALRNTCKLTFRTRISRLGQDHDSAPVQWNMGTELRRQVRTNEVVVIHDVRPNAAQGDHAQVEYVRNLSVLGRHELRCAMLLRTCLLNFSIERCGGRRRRGRRAEHALLLGFLREEELDESPAVKEARVEHLARRGEVVVEVLELPLRRQRLVRPRIVEHERHGATSEDAFLETIVDVPNKFCFLLNIVARYCILRMHSASCPSGVRIQSSGVSSWVKDVSRIKNGTRF